MSSRLTPSDTDRWHRHGAALAVAVLLALMWGLLLWFSAIQHRRLLNESERALDLVNRALVEQTAGVLHHAEHDLRRLEAWISARAPADPLADPGLSRLLRDGDGDRSHLVALAVPHAQRRGGVDHARRQRRRSPARAAALDAAADGAAARRRRRAAARRALRGRPRPPRAAAAAAPAAARRRGGGRAGARGPRSADGAAREPAPAARRVGGAGAQRRRGAQPGAAAARADRHQPPGSAAGGAMAPLAGGGRGYGQPQRRRRRADAPARLPAAAGLPRVDVRHPGV